MENIKKDLEVANEAIPKEKHISYKLQSNLIINIYREYQKLSL